MSRVPAFYEQDDGWSEWVEPLDSEFRFVCCDCGLAHDLEFRVSGKHVQFRARRNNHSTSQIRRHQRTA